MTKIPTKWTFEVSTAPGVELTTILLTGLTGEAGLMVTSVTNLSPIITRLTKQQLQQLLLQGWG